jgi:hypothetical protein
MNAQQHRLYHICIPLLVGLYLWPVSSVHAQTLVEDPAITAMMNRWKQTNLENQEVQGWRIQLIATVDRRQAEAMKRQFEKQYPEYPVHLIHNDPYFHLKFGAFTSMQKAQAYIQKVRADFPQAIPVTEVLKLEEFLLYE